MNIALTRNRISVYSRDEVGREYFIADWPLLKAQAMLADGVVSVVSHKAVVLIPGARIEADTRCKLRHPHAVKPKRADSGSGCDSGRGFHLASRTLHIGIGQSNAGLNHAVQNGQE